MSHWHCNIVDLTHPIVAGSDPYPGDPPCCFTPHTDVASDGYAVTAVALGTHHGTHVDAPAHFIANGAGVDCLSLGRLCGPTYVLDMRHKGEPGSIIDVADLDQFGNLILPGTRLLLRTGWDAHYGHPSYFTDAPGLTVAACEWLATRSIWVLGLDLPTLHPTEVHATHVPLLQSGIAIVESLRLSALDPAHQVVSFFAAPLPLAGLDGSPLRAFALTPPAGSAATDNDRSLSIAPVATAADMLAAFDIRRRVFVAEQQVPLHIELDAADTEAMHVLARLGGKPVGTLRLLRHDNIGTVGRFAVLGEHRNHGIGRALMAWVVNTAPLLGLNQLKLHAQKEAAGFYERSGFTVTGPQFMEAGIPHVPMERSVP